MKVFLWTILFLVTPLALHASPSFDLDTIPVIDMRGLHPTKASTAAIKNSRNDMVVVMVRGGDEELVSKTKKQMDALAHQGYTRIGIIRCDLNEGEIAPALGIAVNGTVYAAIKRAEPSTEHMWQLYRLVLDAYRETILPKIASETNDID